MTTINACRFVLTSFDGAYYGEIWHRDEPYRPGIVPGQRPDRNRRKAKRQLNRYRRFRNRYALMTGQQAPIHWAF